jgi:hypothetical protein
MNLALFTRVLVFAFPCMAIDQVANLQIKVTEGEGMVYASGARSLRPLTVHITDETGRAVAGAAVSFRLPEEGASGVFSNGLRTELAISDAAGRATVRNLQLNRTPGSFRIRVTASRELSRAGTVIQQSITGAGATAFAAPPMAQGLRPSSELPAAGSKSRRKWAAVVALVAAGVGGGLAAGVARHSKVATRTPAEPPVTIGTPSISLGRP